MKRRTFLAGGILVAAAAVFGSLVSSTTAQIAVTCPKPFYINQRDVAGLAPIPVEGTYVGTPPIEASWNGGPWQPINASAGKFAGMLLAQPTGQGVLTVRFTNDQAVFATVADVGIGDVYLVAGQSNAEGRAFNPQFHSHATLIATVSYDNVTWKRCDDKTDLYTKEGSVWPLLATRLLASEGIPVAFITTAQGGTALVNGPWLPPDGNSYKVMKTRLQKSRVTAVKAVLWHQGEKDAANGVTQADYAAALDLLETYMEADVFGAPMVVAQLADLKISNYPSLNQVRLAHRAAWDTNPRTLPGPTLYELGPLADGVHLKTDAEMNALADRWHLALQSHFYGGPTSRGPRLLSAVGRQQITLSFDRELADQAAYEGLRVTDSGTIASIGSVVKSAANELTVTPAAVPAGEIRVSLGHTNDGVGKQVPRSLDGLPGEVFLDQLVN